MGGDSLPWSQSKGILGGVLSGGSKLLNPDLSKDEFEPLEWMCVVADPDCFLLAL